MTPFRPHPDSCLRRNDEGGASMSLTGDPALSAARPVRLSPSQRLPSQREHTSGGSRIPAAPVTPRRRLERCRPPSSASGRAPQRRRPAGDRAHVEHWDRPLTPTDFAWIPTEMSRSDRGGRKNDGGIGLPHPVTPRRCVNGLPQTPSARTCRAEAAPLAPSYARAVDVRRCRLLLPSASPPASRGEMSDRGGAASRRPH